MAEAQPKKRKRRRITSGEAQENTESKSCGESCEDELFRFSNKQSSLEALSEETLKEVQKELYEDCRKEDVETEIDSGKWKKHHNYNKAWNDLENRSVDTPPSSRGQHDSSAKRTPSLDDSDEEDDSYLYMATTGGYQLPPSTQSQTLLSNVSQTLHNLRKRRQSSPVSPNDSIIDCTPSSPTSNTDYNITLRIRCRGSVHRYKTLTVKPFSEVLTQLADDLGVVKERILLSFNTESIPLNATPDGLGLTTVDFLDALVMEKAITDELVVPPEDDPNQITIRVQSTTKSVNYRLKKADPLDKVLTAFSSAMEVARERVKFVFDGDPVEPTSTAEELGLEDDDVIDARVMTDD